MRNTAGLARASTTAAWCHWSTAFFHPFKLHAASHEFFARKPTHSPG